MAWVLQQLGGLAMPLQQGAPLWGVPTGDPEFG
jgi:hypothetical protein